MHPKPPLPARSSGTEVSGLARTKKNKKIIMLRKKGEDHHKHANLRPLKSKRNSCRAAWEEERTKVSSNYSKRKRLHMSRRIDYGTNQPPTPMQVP